MFRMLAVAALVGVNTMAMGYTINIDFTPNIDPALTNTGVDIYSVAYNGTAAAPDAGVVWNSLAAANALGNDYNFEDTNIGLYDAVDGAVASYSDLLDSNGAATGVDVRFDAGGSFAVSNNASNLGNIATDAQGLMRDYLIAFNDATRSVTLSGLPAGQEVILYLYGEGDNLANDRSTMFTVGGQVASTTGDAGGVPLTLGMDYVVLNDVFADANGEIVITYQPNGAPEAPFNGLQLLTVPEPTSALLLGMAATVTLAFTRTKRGG
jgi:hypothetical protein